MLSMTKVNDSYVPIQGIVGHQSTILEKLGSSISILAQIAKEENDRLAGGHPTQGIGNLARKKSLSLQKKEQAVPEK